MKKTGFFRGMLDGLRSTVSQPSSSAKALLEAEFEDNLKPSNFQVETIVRHGFPYQPTAIAYDPIQRLIAIGTKNGSLRILGRPGVDISVRHVTEFAVLQIIFIINEGQLITICADDSLHLWNLRNKKLEIVHTLKFQKERITYCHMTFQSKWLYIGTERGNIHMVNVDTFVLSGYVINWNKAIEISRKTHPGSIIHLSDCPIDSNKLLIGYESGIIVLWDLRNKCADFRHCYNEGIQSISWHSEGRQFICSHNNGSLSTWTAKASKPASSIYPHSKSIATDYKPEPCSPIAKVEWRTVRNGEAYIMFSGGLPVDSGGGGGSAAAAASSGATSTTGTGVNSNQVLTVIYGKSTTVLEMEHDIVDFITLCESPYEADYNDPYAIVVLLSNDLVVVDLQTPGYPCFLNPYPMDLHESPVTYCYYLADCPPDLVRAFFTVGHKLNKRIGYSTREWPINGGEWGSSTVSYPEIIITGHADGSLKFWDASSVNLQVLYKLKTPKLFEKPKVSSNNGNSSSQSDSVIAQESEDPFAIEYLIFSAENRTLCVAGACSQVIVFRFSKQDTQSEIAVIEVPMNYDELEPQADTEIQSGTAALLYQASAIEVHDNSVYYPLKARTGHHKRLSGFQAEIVCVSPWIDRKTPPYRITSMCHNVHASLLAYGTENSVVIIDQIQKSIVLNVSTSSLYGTSDPYPRVQGKQKRCTSAGPYSKEGDNNNGISEAERCRSPITESSSVVVNNDDDDDLYLIEPPQTPVLGCSTNLVMSGPMVADRSPTSPLSPSSELSELLFQSPSTSAPSSSLSSPQPSSCSSTFPLPDLSTTTTPSSSSNNNVDQSQFGLIDTSLFPPLTEFSNLPEVAVPISSPSESSTLTSLESPVPELMTEFKFPSVVAKPVELSPKAADIVDQQATTESCPKAPPRRKRSKFFGFRKSENLAASQLTPSIPEESSEIKELKNKSDEAKQLIETTSIEPTSPTLTDQSPTSVEDIEVALEAVDLKLSPLPSASDSAELLFKEDVVKSSLEADEDQQPSALLCKDSLDLNLSSVSCSTDSASLSLQSSCGVSSINSSSQQLPPRPHNWPYVGWELFSRYKHHKFVDFQHDDSTPNSDTFVGRIFNKLDSFTRSRSSSMSSLENVGNESIQFLSFANTFVNKNDTAPSPTLWVGTSCGSVVIISLTMPDSVDNRILCLQTVLATPSASIFRMKGTILNIGFLDANGNQLPLNPEQWKDRSRPESTTPAPTSVEAKRTGSLTITRTGSGGTPSRQPKISPTSSAADVRDSHFVVLTSEKQIRLLVMPLQACAQKATITETSFAVRADIVSMKSHDALCLAAYLGTGNIVVYSLPSLHLLIDIDFLPLTDVRIARTIFFSTNGHGMYLSSPSELTKFTISSSFCENLSDMVGTVYNGPKDLPEQPKQSFLKGLFGGAPSPLDREELFGENSSGKASKTTARLIPGSMEHAKANTSNLGGEFAKLREGFNERGERLGKLEDKTAQMQNEAEAFSSVAHAVMLKYRDKKWYQF